MPDNIKLFILGVKFMTQQRSKKDHTHVYVYGDIGIRKIYELCFKLSNLIFGNKNSEI